MPRVVDAGMDSGFAYGDAQGSG